MARGNIVLIGFMGTGKSAVGKELAELCGWTFVDSDGEIERTEGRKIPKIFAENGEAYFRMKEEAVLHSLLKGSRQVIATGGGAVLSAANREAMLSGGFVVALTATVATIVSRVARDTNRPLLQGNLEERVNTLMAVRKDAYGFAELFMETDEREPAAIAADIYDEYIRQHAPETES